MPAAGASDLLATRTHRLRFIYGRCANECAFPKMVVASLEPTGLAIGRRTTLTARAVQVVATIVDCGRDCHDGVGGGLPRDGLEGRHLLALITSLTPGC